MTKAEARKARQAEHAQREQARLEVGDTRNARERQQDVITAQAKARRRKPRRASMSSQQRAESYGGLIGGYETDDTYCPD